MNYYQAYGKRILDLSFCLLSMPLVLPLLGLIILISALSNQDTIIFRQLRPGFGTKGFTLYKMGTLRDRVSDNGRRLSDGERQSRWGRVMRNYSLDELPQWYNVLRGDMSWVGPRPLLSEYLAYYSPRQSKRHTVKPGLTGLAQVMGRNQLSWDRKLACDYLYVKNQCLRLDAWILFQTLRQFWKKPVVNYGDRGLVSPPEMREQQT